MGYTEDSRLAWAIKQGLICVCGGGRGQEGYADNRQVSFEVTGIFHNDERTYLGIKSNNPKCVNTLKLNLKTKPGPTLLMGNNKTKHILDFNILQFADRRETRVRKQDCSVSTLLTFWGQAYFKIIFSL